MFSKYPFIWNSLQSLAQCHLDLCLLRMSNLTGEYSFSMEEIPLADRAVAGVFWILYMFPGNALLFGMVQFDRMGGDPLKRRITDQVQNSNKVVSIKLATYFIFF